MKKIFAIAILILALCSVAGAQYSTTPNIGLLQPNLGITNWNGYINGDFGALDSIIGGVGALTVNSTTPSVFLGQTWNTANTVSTTITNFTGGFQGQKISIVCGDTHTSIASSLNIFTNSSFTCTLNAVIGFVFDGSMWVETGRNATGGGIPYPALGLTVSTGAAWATSIPVQSMAPNENVIYVLPSCATQVNCFTANFDAQETYNATFTSGSAVVTTGSTEPPFLPSDVGKVCYGTSASSAGFTSQLSSATVMAACTISTYTNPHQVTTNVNATANCTTANACLFRWGHDDTAALANAEAAVGCGTMVFPVGATIVSAAWMTTVPACTKNVNSGPSFVGKGNSSTRFFIAQNFNYSSCTLGITGKACFGGISNTASAPVQGLYSNFGISGGGISNLGVVPHIGFELDGQDMYFVNINAWGANDGAASCTTDGTGGAYSCFVGFWSASIGGTTYELDVDGAGKTGCVIGANQNFMFGGYCGDNSRHSLDFAVSPLAFDSFGSTFGPTGTIVTCMANLYGTGQTWRSHGDWIGIAPFSPGGTGSAAVCSWGTGDVFNVQGSYVEDASSNGNGYACQVSGATLIAQGTVFVGAGSGGAINNVNAGCKTFNLGGNTFTGGIVNSVNAPVLSIPEETLSGTCASNAATVTFHGTYAFAPQVNVSDTTSGATGAQATTTSTTTATIHCNGASDTFNATVIPNPF